MLNLHSLEISPGSRKTPKRVGRGTGSGLGRNSGKGEKGQKSRSGGGVRLGFEGGQMPVYRTVPKRGFTNTRGKKYSIVNIESLNIFENNSEITEESLLNKKIIKKLNDGVKILSRGELQKCLTVKVSKFSQEAKNKIEALGGKAEVI